VVGALKFGSRQLHFSCAAAASARGRTAPRRVRPSSSPCGATSDGRRPDGPPPRLTG